MKTTESRQYRSVMIGIVAVVLLWISAGISVPQVKQYNNFRPEILLIVRGVAVLLAFLVMSRFTFGTPDKYVVLGGTLLAISSITFFQAINLWGPNPVITIITLTPLVNFVVAHQTRKRIGHMTVISLVFVIAGTVLALDVFRETLHPTGFVLSIIASITAGLGIDAWGLTKTNVKQKMVWYSTCLIVLSSLVLVLTPGKVEFIPDGVKIIKALYIFLVMGCFGGIVYICTASIVLQKLPTTTASILFQGETPAVMIGAWLTMGDKLTLRQGVGVLVMIFGICLLTLWTAKLARNSTKPSS